MDRRAKSPSPTPHRSLQHYDRLTPARVSPQRYFVAREKSTSSEHSLDLLFDQEETTNLLSYRRQPMSVRRFQNTQPERTDRSKFPSRPFLSFDIEGWGDQFYSSPLEWGRGGLIGLADGPRARIFNPVIHQPDQGVEYYDFDTPPAPILTSLTFSKIISAAAISDDRGQTVLFDYVKESVSMLPSRHHVRVICSGFHQNVLALGFSNGSVTVQDMRESKRRKVGTFQLHDGSVCGLSWNHDTGMLATGGNDSAVWVVDLRKKAMIDFEHGAAVRAICWHGNTLITGAGARDRKIRKWDVGEGNLMQSVDSESQVCSLTLSKDLLITGQGYSINEILFWDVGNLKRKHALKQHEGRVLYTALSDDGRMLATGGADRKLHLWRLSQGELRALDFPVLR